MRYPSSEKLEIIRLVEQSHLPAKRTLDTLGVPRTTFYRWYDRYLSGGVEALEDRCPKPGHVWNRIPDDIRERIFDLALEEPELSPRELAVRFTDTQSYFVSEASVYRLLKAHDLITSPAFVVIKAADEFRDKTTAINQMWQTDFTYLKVIGWGWFYLSTILDDFSRYIIAWKLCTTMKAGDVTDTLEMALQASGCDQANVIHRPRLLSDNGASYIAPMAILGDVIDYDILKTGKNKAASFAALNSLLVKISNALGIAVALPTLGLFGYVMGVEADFTAWVGLMIAYVGIPGVTYAIASWLIWFFPIDARRHSIIVRRIETRPGPRCP